MRKLIRSNLWFILGLVLIIYLVRVLDIAEILAPVLIILFVYIKISYQRPKIKTFNMLHLIFLLTLMITIAKGIIVNAISAHLIPIAILGMLVTIFFSNLELTFISVSIASIAIGIIANNDFALTVFLMVGGLSSGLLVLRVRRRSNIVLAGLLTGLIQFVSIFFIDNLQIHLHDTSKYLMALFNGVGCAILVGGTLSMFEYLFDTITNISLLEMSDFNHPLLKKMTLEAAGTYHHSLIVGNLSESACEAIGANALLARIGAYYHDIGKIEKAEYFSENQNISLSKHNKLSASISKALIMNHVKEGLELAKKYRLNHQIIDFINQHHGTSLVYYFYRRALEELEENKDVQEEGFRYPGPKPNTRETAVVLLADSVEAASRALTDPTPAKIEELTHKIINNKFIDGQLDECDLTLKNLEKIANIFSRILGGIYHARIQYPDENTQDTNTKLPKPNQRFLKSGASSRNQDNESSESK